MFESSEEEGGALGSLGIETGFDGKKIKTINKYRIFSTSINQLIKDKILEVPNYVKIDVMVLFEHLILFYYLVDLVYLPNLIPKYNIL